MFQYFYTYNKSGLVYTAAQASSDLPRNYQLAEEKVHNSSILVSY